MFRHLTSSPGTAGAFFVSLCIGRSEQGGKVRRWSDGHDAPRQCVVTSPGPSFCLAAGRGAWMIPLLGQWALQLVENQLAMPLEYAQRRFERMEHRLSNLQVVADIQRVLEDYVLASDVGLHFGNVTVGLGKMAANHRSKDTGIPDCEKSKPRLGRCTSAKRSYGAGRPVCVGEVEARACPLRQLLRGMLQYLPHEQHTRWRPRLL